MIGGGRRRLRRSAFCRADPAGQPSPASRLRRLFWGSGVARSVILSGGFLSPSRKNGLMIGAADGGCPARLFVGLTLPGSPPPLCGSAAFGGWQRGCEVGYLIGRIFISLPQEWLNDRVGRRRLRRSAFCRADPAGQPSPASRLRRLFWGSGVARSVILSGGFLSPSRKNGLMIGAADGGCPARLFVGLTLPGSPPPLCGSAAYFGGAGLHFCRKKRENQRGSRASSMRRSSSWG